MNVRGGSFGSLVRTAFLVFVDQELLQRSNILDTFTAEHLECVHLRKFGKLTCRDDLNCDFKFFRFEKLGKQQSVRKGHLCCYCQGWGLAQLVSTNLLILAAGISVYQYIANNC